MASNFKCDTLRGKAQIAAAIGKSEVWLWRHLRGGGALDEVIDVSGSGRRARYTASRARLLAAWRRIEAGARRTVAQARRESK